MIKNSYILTTNVAVIIWFTPVYTFIVLNFWGFRTALFAVSLLAF